MHIKIKKTRIAEDGRYAQSKWWGSPDLPAEMDFPQIIDANGDAWDMTFICQINCADLREYNTPLPKEGLLLFFANIDFYLGYNEPEPSMEGVWDAQDVRVIYVAPEQFDTLEQKILIDADDNPIAIQCREIELEYSQEDSSGEYNKLFGSPDGMPWEDWDAPCEGWKVLLQVDSDEADDYNLQFMDEGIMYFLISPDDLSKADFSHVRGAMISM